MATNDYVFVTRWEVDSSPAAVFAVLADAARLPAWWPSVYLDVAIRARGDAKGIGERVDLFTKGWLPYTLRWTFVVEENEPPRRMALRASGDLEGRGVWTLDPRLGGGTTATYDWRIRAGKPLLRALSFVMKPIFAANHRWAMDRGLESLRLELARRAAKTAEERARVPPPPPPTWPHARWHEKGRRPLVSA